MPHLTLLVFFATLASGVAGVVLLVQLHQRYAFRFLRSGTVQLCLFNSIVALNVFYLYYRLNLAGDGATRVDLGVEIAYHAVSPVLKLGWVVSLWVMVLDLLNRPPSPPLRHAGWIAGAVLLVAAGALAGHAAVATTLDLVAGVHVAVELPAILAALAAIAFMVVRSRALEEPERRRLARELGTAVLAVWTLATATFLGGILFDLPGREMRLFSSALLLFAYNLIPIFVFRTRLGGLAARPAEPDAACGPDWKRFGETFGISPREREIVELICKGKRNREIADELFISLQTVKDHNYRIYRKLGVRNRVQLVNLVRDGRS
jgi:DNA-binding CsgD family transcriptional regulator